MKTSNSSRSRLLRLISEEIPQVGEVHQVGNTADIFGNLVLDQSAENDGGAARNRHGRRQSLAINDRDLVPRDITLLPRVSLIWAILRVTSLFELIKGITSSRSSTSS